MGSLILCHKKKAKQPYVIAQIHCKIFTLEELCYYLSHHIYLLDDTTINKKLLEWLDRELDCGDLAEELGQIMAQYGSLEQMVLRILTYSSIYTEKELGQMKRTLETFKQLKPIERLKHRADTLMQSGAYQTAISIYRKILQEESEEAVDKKFFGKVYACLGAAYGRLFLYQKAARMYEAAYQICEDEALLRAYVYACCRFMSKEEYRKLLDQSVIYGRVHQELEMICKETKIKEPAEGMEQTISAWKEQYRKMGIGEK